MARRERPFQFKQRARTNRRARRPSFGARLLDAHNRACDRVNRPGNRRQRMSRQSAIAGTAVPEDFEEHHLPMFKRILHWVLAFALVPLCFITVVTLFQRVNSENFILSFWRSSSFFYFTIGVALMIGWFISGLLNNFFLYLYVLGHEMTHAMFVYLCFGRISDIRVSTDGGYIMTNKSNIIIALSPYFVPFWSLVAISLHGFLNWSYPIPHSEDALILILGGTWCFHVIWTAWMIPKDQPDLKENGTFYSLMIIILANLIILGALMCITSNDLTFAKFAFNWWNNVLDSFEGFQRALGLGR